MPCPLRRQRENHTGVLASDSSHEYIVDRRLMCLGKLYMSPKQTCLCLTQYVYAKCENGHVFAKTTPQSIITTALQ